MNVDGPSIQLDKLMDLDRVIHERVRLGIMTALSASGVLSFQDLKNMLNVTDGNLSVHLKHLERHEYVVVQKDFIKRKPHSTYRLTDNGVKAFKGYISNLELLITQLQLG